MNIFGGKPFGQAHALSPHCAEGPRGQGWSPSQETCYVIDTVSPGPLAGPLGGPGGRSFRTWPFFVTRPPSRRHGGISTPSPETPGRELSGTSAGDPNLACPFPGQAAPEALPPASGSRTHRPSAGEREPLALSLALPTGRWLCWGPRPPVALDPEHSSRRGPRPESRPRPRGTGRSVPQQGRSPGPPRQDLGIGARSGWEDGGEASGHQLPAAGPVQTGGPRAPR